MKLFTYHQDTKGGTDWTEEHTIIAEDRESADRFFKEKKEEGLIPYDDKFSVLLAVEVDELSIPNFWRD